jgi:hypothetical protein
LIAMQSREGKREEQVPRRENEKRDAVFVGVPARAGATSGEKPKRR